MKLPKFGHSVVFSPGHCDVGGADVAEGCVFACLGISGFVELGEFEFDVYCARLRKLGESIELWHGTFFS